MERPDPMGHDFDNDDAVCPCGQSWVIHQSIPTTCMWERPVAEGLPKSPYTLHSATGDSPIEGLRKLMGLSIPTVAQAAGVSTRTAGRALAGQVGNGHGSTSMETAREIAKVVTDLAAHTGQSRGGAR